jgi:hypothetical protein
MIVSRQYWDKFIRRPAVIVVIVAQRPWYVKVPLTFQQRRLLPQGIAEMAGTTRLKLLYHVNLARIDFSTTYKRVEAASKHILVVQGIAYCGSDLEKRARLTCNLPLDQLPIFTDGQRHRQGVTRMSELARPHECTLVR